MSTKGFDAEKERKSSLNALVNFDITKKYNNYKKDAHPTTRLFNQPKGFKLSGKSKDEDKQIKALCVILNNMNNIGYMNLGYPNLKKSDIDRLQAEVREKLYCALHSIKPEKEGSSYKLVQLRNEMMGLIEKTNPNVKEMTDKDKDEIGQRAIEAASTLVNKKDKPK